MAFSSEDRAQLQYAQGRRFRTDCVGRVTVGVSRCAGLIRARFLIRAHVKEAIAVLLIALAAFVYLRSSSTTSPQPRPKRGAVEEDAPVRSTASVVVTPLTSNSVSDRWKTGPGAQASVTLIPSDRWQMVPTGKDANGKDRLTPGAPGRWEMVPVGKGSVTPGVPGRWETAPNAQASVTPGVSGRWKTGSSVQTDLTASPPDRWKGK